MFNYTIKNTHQVYPCFPLFPDRKKKTMEKDSLPEAQFPYQLIIKGHKFKCFTKTHKRDKHFLREITKLILPYL